MSDSTYKIGDIVFNSKSEYEAAQADLIRIKYLMGKFDTTNPDEAQSLLDKLGKKPGFNSAYGDKFLERLTATAANSKKALALAEKKAKAEEKKKKSAGKKRQGKGVGHSIHIITKRNIFILAGILVLALGVKFGLFNPKGFDIREHIGISGDASENEVKVNLVLQYAKTQAEFVSDLSSYYIGAHGLDAATARKMAQEEISRNYIIDFTGEDLSKYSDKKILKLYKQLEDGGDIIDGCFIEPEAITEFKKTMAEADFENTSGEGSSGNQGSASGDAGDGYQDVVEEIPAKSLAINKMMDYQCKVASQLEYDYSHFGYDDSVVRDNVKADMDRIFTYIIYDLVMGDEDKEMYYDSFVNLGLMNEKGPIEFSSNPEKGNMPELTPNIALDFKNGFSVTASCAQQTVSPASEVTYALYGDSVNGYIMFRNNGTGSDYILGEAEKSCLIMGDFYMLIDNQITIGSWFNNSGRIGIVVNDAYYGDISNVFTTIY